MGVHTSSMVLLWNSMMVLLFTGKAQDTQFGSASSLGTWGIMALLLTDKLEISMLHTRRLTRVKANRRGPQRVRQNTLDPDCLPS